MSVCSSVSPHLSAHLLLGVFPCSFLVETFAQIWWESSDLVKIEQKIVPHTWRRKYVSLLPATFYRHKSVLFTVGNEITHRPVSSIGADFSNFFFRGRCSWFCGTNIPCSFISYESLYIDNCQRYIPRNNVYRLSCFLPELIFKCFHCEGKYSFMTFENTKSAFRL
jgi:hypothetical protein